MHKHKNLGNLCLILAIVCIFQNISCSRHKICPTVFAFSTKTKHTNSAMGRLTRIRIVKLRKIKAPSYHSSALFFPSLIQDCRQYKSTQINERQIDDESNDNSRGTNKAFDSPPSNRLISKQFIMNNRLELAAKYRYIGRLFMFLVPLSIMANKRFIQIGWTSFAFYLLSYIVHGGVLSVLARAAIHDQLQGDLYKHLNLVAFLTAVLGIITERSAFSLLHVAVAFFITNDGFAHGTKSFKGPSVDEMKGWIGMRKEVRYLVLNDTKGVMKIVMNRNAQVYRLVTLLFAFAALGYHLPMLIKYQISGQSGAMLSARILAVQRMLLASGITSVLMVSAEKKCLNKFMPMRLNWLMSVYCILGGITTFAQKFIGRTGNAIKSYHLIPSGIIIVIGCFHAAKYIEALRATWQLESATSSQDIY